MTGVCILVCALLPAVGLIAAGLRPSRGGEPGEAAAPQAPRLSLAPRGASGPGELAAAVALLGGFGVAGFMASAASFAVGAALHLLARVEGHLERGGRPAPKGRK